MTPERARKLATRWSIAATLIVPGFLVALNPIGLGVLAWGSALIGGMLCMTQVGLWIGWERGYRHMEARRES